MKKDLETIINFPKDFRWGTATASTQVEGDLDNEWYHYKAKDGTVYEKACDSYNLWKEDIDLMKKMNVNSYRFGIPWERLQKKLYGKLDKKEVAHYHKMIDYMKKQGIEPMVTLHHFSNPNWFIKEKNGWSGKEAEDLFKDYVRKIASEFKDDVKLWITFNEPEIYVLGCHFSGQIYPYEKARLLKTNKVLKKLASCHKAARNIIKKINPDAEVGIAKSENIFYAYGKNPLDKLAAKIADKAFNKYLEKLFFKNSDFIGINYYGRTPFKNLIPLAPIMRTASIQKMKQLGLMCDEMQEKYPKGIDEIVTDVYARYNLPIYITENGCGTKDDSFREKMLKETLVHLGNAINRGVDVRGYYHWSLLDNYEWEFGISKKFGLHEVDFDTFERKPKPSAKAYGKICKENKVIRK